MSWAAHQFEGYVLQRHFGERYQVSYLAIVAGDAVPDFCAKAWVYGVTVNGHHYGASDPADFHRSWPGAGFTHSLAFGALVGVVVWAVARRRPWAIPWSLGLVIGQWAHALTDINDSKGTMLLFPFSTHNFSIGTWAYGAQVGKYHDAAAYFSSLGFVMDTTWLLILLLFARRVLTRAYFRRVIQPADPTAWAWLSRHLPPDALVAAYRAMFVYGLARMISWTTWAHVVESFAWDLRWGGPSWLTKVPPSRQTWPWVAAGVAGVGAAMWMFWFVGLRPHRRDGSASTATLAPAGQSVTMP
jgi:membrane-bound metal-dependent hydrolase YbcI (DUF457 family)